MGASTRAASADQVAPVEPTAHWRASLSKPAAGTPAIGATVIAVTSADRWLTLLDRESGDRLWRKRLDAGGAGDVVIAGDRLYAATTGREGAVYSFALSNGHRYWDREVGSVAGSIALDGGRVLVATERGTVYALGVDRGAELWRRHVGGPIRSGVVPLESGILVSTFDELLLLDRRDGTVIRRVEAPGAVLTAPAVVDGLVIIGSPDGLVAALDAVTLEERWRLPMHGEVLGGVAVARDTVFAATIDGMLFRIPLEEPSAYHSTMTGFPIAAPPAPVANGILLGSAGGEVILVSADAPTGRPLFRVDGRIDFPAVVRDRTIYVADGRGKVEAWR